MKPGEIQVGGPGQTYAVASDDLTINFTPTKGDIISFDSDWQTEKGPSSGWVKWVNYKNGLCSIIHSDSPGEEFEMAKVEVKVYKRRKDGKRYWLLK